MRIFKLILLIIIFSYWAYFIIAQCRQRYIQGSLDGYQSRINYEHGKG